MSNIEKEVKTEIQRSGLDLSNSTQLIYCPYTGEQVVRQNWKEFATPNGRLVWWQCIACQGWHLLLDELSKDKLLDNSSPETTG